MGLYGGTWRKIYRSIDLYKDRRFMLGFGLLIFGIALASVVGVIACFSIALREYEEI